MLFHQKRITITIAHWRCYHVIYCFFCVGTFLNIVMLTVIVRNSNVLDTYLHYLMLNHTGMFAEIDDRTWKIFHRLPLIFWLPLNISPTIFVKESEFKRMSFHYLWCGCQAGEQARATSLSTLPFNLLHVSLLSHFLLRSQRRNDAIAVLSVSLTHFVWTLSSFIYTLFIFMLSYFTPCAEQDAKSARTQPSALKQM